MASIPGMADLAATGLGFAADVTGKIMYTIADKALGLGISSLDKVILTIADRNKKKKPKVIEVEMPLEIYEDKEKSDIFMDLIREKEAKNNVMYKIRVEEPKIIKIPKELKSEESKLNKIYSKIEELEKKGVKVKKVFI